MSGNAGSKVIFFLVGLGIGSLIGILLAPTPGEEARESLLDKADESREYARGKARQLRERAEELLKRSGDISLEAGPGGPGKVPHG